MRATTTALITAFALLVPGSALAASSTCQAYNPQALCTVLGSNKTKTTSTSPTRTVVSNAAGSSTLPFTGLDAGLLVVGGIGLLGAGLVLRRTVGRTE
jgi:hypothetical protein